MGFEKFPTIYWVYLIIAIMASAFSVTYWIYKFSQWLKRRKRRLARCQRSQQEVREKLESLREEREEILAERAELEDQIAAAGAFSRWFRGRSLQSRLQEAEQREQEIDEEIGQLEPTNQA